MNDSTFQTLSRVECKTELKGRLTYVSWAEAWGRLCEHFPNASFEVHLGEEGTPLMQGWVSVSVTVQDRTHREWLPVLDGRNRPIEDPNPFDVNRAVKRCLAKAIALHGLGLYVYQGEDLPEADDQPARPKNVRPMPAPDADAKPEPAITTPQIRNIHRLGKELYGDEWDDKRHEKLKNVGGSVKKLTNKQAAQFITWLERRLEEAVENSRPDETEAA